MSGYVPKHASFTRTIFISASIIFSVYLAHYEPDNEKIAFIYFAVSEFMYIAFIMLVLSENGLRLWFLETWKNADDAYLVYEGVLGFLFFHNAISIGYVASATSGKFLLFTDNRVLILVCGIPFIAGFLVKILAARAVTIDIYYWKDMFLGKKISDFVVAGPYKYFSNPMYGVGQAQAYAAALWYGSGWGILAALLNQALIFTFYFLFEKKFIDRVYLKRA
jgi:protein-S-isoprenylcysteine O-methyltransferase Ste14